MRSIICTGIEANIRHLEVDPVAISPMITRVKYTTMKSDLLLVNSPLGYWMVSANDLPVLADALITMAGHMRRIAT